MKRCKQRIRVWHARGVVGRKVDHKAEPGLRDKAASTNAEPTNLDHALKLGHGADNDSPILNVQPHPVIADERGCWDLPGAASQNQVEGEAGFAGAGRTANQDADVARLHS